MSRSRKEPIVKDRPRNYKKSTDYWRHVRRVIKNTVHKLFYKDEDDVTIPNPKEVVNDYDYSDYKFDARDIKKEKDREKYIKKMSRK